MKATVVQIKDKYAVLLQEDGSFIKVKARNLEIGDVVNKRVMSLNKKGKLSSMVAAALFAVLIGGGVYTYGAPSYYVSIDVNPGIIMEVNRFERVISWEAANADAEVVLEGLELNNKDIEEAIILTVERIADLGYFDEEGGNILISAMSEEDEEANQLSEQLEDAVKEELEENGTKAEVISKVIGYEMVQASREFEGMTPGKYNIIVNLLGAEPETVLSYADTSIKDIMKEVKAAKDAAKTKETKDDSAEDKSLKEEKKSSDKTDKADKKEEKAADEVEQNMKNTPIDKAESNRNSKDSKKKSIEMKKIEAEKKKDSLEQQKREKNQELPLGSDEKEEPGKP